MKNTLLKSSLLLMATATILFSSCKKNEDSAYISVYMISGTASGDQIKPIVTTNGNGSISGSYTTSTHAFEYLINWNNLGDIASTVQLRGPADPGADGVVVSDLGITTGGVSGASNGTLTLTDAQASALIQGKLYYVIMNPTHPGGEIRGQISAIAR